MSPAATRFRDVYERHLLASISANPGDYVDTVESAQATDLAGRMTMALARGSAQVSTTAKRAARELGIPPTRSGIMAFLAGDLAAK